MFNFGYNILSISNSNISMHHPDLDRVRPKTVKGTDILTILLHKKRHVKRGHTSTVNNTFFKIDFHQHTIEKYMYMGFICVSEIQFS